MTQSAGRVLPRALRAALPLYIGLVVTYGAAFAFKALLITHVFSGPEQMARLETLDRALQWIVAIVLLGVPAALQRRLAEEPNRRWPWIGSAFLLCGIALGVVALVVRFVPAAPEWLVGEDNAKFAGACVNRAAGLGCLAICGAVLLAAGRIGWKATIEASERVLALAAPLAILVIAAPLRPGDTDDPQLQEGALQALVDMTAATSWLTGLGALLLLALLLGKRSSAEPPSRPGRAAALLRTGAPQLALSVFENVRPLVLLRMATYSVGDREAGLLGVAMAFSLPLIVLPELVSQALFPKMLGPDGEGSHVEGERRRLFREVLIAGALALAAYGALAAWLLPHAKDGKYEGAVVPLLVLLPGVLAHGLTAHTGYVLLVRDRLAYAAGASVAALAASVALAWALLPTLGATGGALALTAGLLLRTALYQIAARRT